MTYPSGLCTPFNIYRQQMTKLLCVNRSVASRLIQAPSIKTRETHVDSFSLVLFRRNFQLATPGSNERSVDRNGLMS